ncbi:MAG TPA: response regulator [Candidatus Saccharibacteria bacterium]|nr:response regulator [Candidatus Saccharibacteria bacterium]
MVDVLLIEPDAILGSTYKKILQRAGYKVDLQTTAQTAIHALDRQNPKLIILEIQLGEHNGIEFLYELRSHPDWHDIPIIINSLIPEDVLGISPLVAEELGISRVLYKPKVTLDNLLSVTADLVKAKDASAK